MTRANLILAAIAGSAALLAGAFGFEHLGGLQPCQLCIWQRWPHAAAVLIGVLALLAGKGGAQRLLAGFGGFAAASTAALGAFHAGVEQKWWAGLASCSAGSVSGISGADLLNTDIVLAPVVRCDAVAWAMFGVSMASWNALASFGLVVIWAMAARRS